MFRIWLLSFILVGFSGCEAHSSTRPYRLKERVEAGSLVYTAMDTRWYLSLGHAPPLRIPLNRFLVVNLKVSNGGATNSTVPALSLVDDDGQTFRELADGSGVPEWLGAARKIQPMNARTGNVIFDVAPRHYKLRVSDETDQIAAFIDIPLKLIADESAP